MENITYDPCYNVTYPDWTYRPWCPTWCPTWCPDVREYYYYYYVCPINLCGLYKKIEELENKVKELEQKIDTLQKK